jgi:transposase-like protein
MSARMTPFHCPYCGEENLWPHEGDSAQAGSGHGAWECRSCMRAFKVSFLGILRPQTSTEDTLPDPASEERVES